ncbi:MAG: alpha/beta fold hydrolase, partial [Acidimicrobiales bacterium]
IDLGVGHPVVLLHGQPGSQASWNPLVDHLSSRFRVVVPDRPGYGNTPGEARGLSDNADMVADLLRNRGATPATVVGHSWSGGVAILLAVRHPETVRSLVLVGAVGTAGSINAFDRLLVVPGIGDALTVAGLTGVGVVLPRIRKLVHPVGRSRVAPTSKAGGFIATTLPSEAMPGGWRGAWGRDRRTFLIEQRALLEELPAISASLAEVNVPTSVVIGTWDLVVPQHAAHELAAAIHGAHLVQIPCVGHFVARDAPARLTEVIASTDHRAEILPAT